MNLALGSVLATIGLTIPAVACVAMFLGKPLRLGLGRQRGIAARGDPHCWSSHHSDGPHHRAPRDCPPRSIRRFSLLRRGALNLEEPRLATG